MYVSKVPGFFWRLFPGIVWRLPMKEKTLFLTFDDGPTPGVTDFVMNTLDEYNAKATFFCIGKIVSAHPKMFEDILKRGHSVGNHTYNHLNGWQAEDEVYYDDIAQCAKEVNSNLFRPPYGKITLPQMRYLKPQYKIVMWDVLSGDFDPLLSAESCLENVLRHSREGSIIVLHDSMKAEPKVKFVLPRVLEYFSEAGYTFQALGR
jgi:peptidoglycan/xylan/chitin deacetylase (PgdA/CDA1 family)